MAFSIDTRDIPALPDYITALSHWQKVKPIRGCPDPNERPLASRRKKHINIRQLADGSIACRLYRHDLVVYRPDGTYAVDVSYASTSTQSMINKLLFRTPVHFQITSGQPVMWLFNRETGCTRGKVIDGNVAQLDANFQLLNSKVIKVRTLNVKKANELRKKYRYSEFTSWRAVYEKMTGKDAESYHPWQRKHAKYRPNRLNITETLDMLRLGPEAWIDLAAECDNEHIVQCIYRQHPEVIDISFIDELEDMNHHSRIVALDRKYGWA